MTGQDTKAESELHMAENDESRPAAGPIVKDAYTWEEYQREYYDNESNSRGNRRDGRPFDPAAILGFDPDDVEDIFSDCTRRAGVLQEFVERQTVTVDPELNEDAFFEAGEEHSTLVDRYDLEKAVPPEEKYHLQEVERYWVNKPYAFVIVFHSIKENEKKYYVIEPHKTEIEEHLLAFLGRKLRTAIKHSDDEALIPDNRDERAAVVERQARRLLNRYDLHERNGPTFTRRVRDEWSSASDALRRFTRRTSATQDPETTSNDVIPGDRGAYIGEHNEEASAKRLAGVAARPEPAVLAENSGTLTTYQVEKLLYYLKRDFTGYGVIDGVKHDINVEDISCDGYDSPVFVYHMDYENLITNLAHGTSDLDDFVVKLAQRSGKGISKSQPQIDATLPDGSRAQLTLGREVSDHGTNYTIRQFKDVPFTPVDLINWHTFSLEEMVFLWLCIENDMSLIFAGGTASGKTTSLNAVSLFIPSNSKIVSIEDTREVELPQRNWVASITRGSFSDDKGDIDEFDLLEAALRQRPEFILMGEVRGEEGRTLFQVMSTGHTTLTTFHADSMGEVLKRFTTDPINVSKTMFTGLDLVSVQTQTRVRGKKVRRNKTITEINHYDAENDEINVRDVFEWQAESDEFLNLGNANTLENLKFDRGWDQERLDAELFKRRVVLAYLIENNLNEYAEVAATLQAFINDQDTILALIAQGELERSLEDLRDMGSVRIDVDPELEALVPRPTPNDDTRALAREVLDRAETDLFEEYRDQQPGTLFGALSTLTEVDDIALPTDERPDATVSTASRDRGGNPTVVETDGGELSDEVRNLSAGRRDSNSTGDDGGRSE